MRFYPQSIFGRVLVVLLAGLVVSHIISLFLYSDERRAALIASGGEQLAERIAASVQAVDAFDPPFRPAIVASLSGPGFAVRWTRESLVDDELGDLRLYHLRGILTDHLSGYGEDRIRIDFMEFKGEDHDDDHEDDHWWRSERRMGHDSMMRGMGRNRHMGAWWQGGRAVEVSVMLKDGTWLNMAAPYAPSRPFWWSRFFLSIFATTLMVLVLTWWAVRRSTRPLNLFARAAERLGRDVNAPPLDENGPKEVRRAARAFNDMQRRLQTHINERTQILAAISHDLRTPMTRLRLRAELTDDEEQRAKMLTDLEQMEAMIAEALAYARDDQSTEDHTAFDLAALLQSIAHDAADVGGNATYDGPDRLTINGAAVGLRRVFSNLADNALAYGEQVRLALKSEGGVVVVSIEDDGPGIAADEMEKVFAPFYRIEGSRSRDTGGVGLGLSVVRSIVRGHDGEVTLENRETGGLRVTVTLPRVSAE